MKIIADKNIPFIKGIVDGYGTVEYRAGTDLTHYNVKDADVLIVRTVTKLDRRLLEDTQVKLICSATIGYDHIDTSYCDTHGIAWRNAPGCNSGSVRQYIVASLLSFFGQGVENLKGKTIGIVGVGHVGTKVATVCSLLGMKVLLNDPPRKEAEGGDLFVGMDTIKNEADIITFHTPLTREGKDRTFHLADADFFNSLKKKPLIINSARGGIVDTKAIVTALKTGQISGAIIDCWENEPGIDPEYLNLVDIATPHIAGYSADGKANASRMSLLSIAGFFGLDKTLVEKIEAPAPINPVIDMNKYTSDRVRNAIMETYNPMDDFARLKNSPDQFKQLRNDYPLRREYSAYTILNARPEERQLLQTLGFKCIP